MATISLNVVIVAYVLQVLHLGVTAYGLSDMTYGVGAMTSGVFAALLVLRLGERPAMTGVTAALIACYVALAGWSRQRSRLLRRALPRRILLVGVSRHHVGLPLQGRAQTR